MGFTDIALSTYAARVVPSALLWGYGTVVPFLPGVAVAAVALVYAEWRRRVETV